LSSARHIFASQSSSYNGVILVLDATTAEFLIHMSCSKISFELNFESGTARRRENWKNLFILPRRHRPTPCGEPTLASASAPLIARKAAKPAVPPPTIKYFTYSGNLMGSDFNNEDSDATTVFFGGSSLSGLFVETLTGFGTSTSAISLAAADFLVNLISRCLLVYIGRRSTPNMLCFMNVESKD
uniref:Uncharacterized protein n=1 Tax=Romanomermis culicivorax TaxID=13658 RepID=A0A915IZH1_ROMCU